MDKVLFTIGTVERDTTRVGHEDQCQNGVVPTHSGSGLAVTANSIQLSPGWVTLTGRT